MNQSQSDIFAALRSIGTVSSVSASYIKLNLHKAGKPSGSLFEGIRYGLGEVSEFVLIESESCAVFGRITEIRLPENERLSVEDEAGVGVEVHALAFVQLLATVSLTNLKVSTGIESYPRLGDKAYSAPHEFIAKIPELMNLKDSGETDDSPVTLELGHVKNAKESRIKITPEKIFGRHCAVLGATGGGKSYTVAKLIEECCNYDCKVILLDATGEYRDLNANVTHFHLGTPFNKHPDSQACSLPPESFREEDFIALFEPSGKVQGPKLRSAIRSLKLVELSPEVSTRGLILKADQPKQPFTDASETHSQALEDPRSKFDPHNLTKQIRQECVFPDKIEGFGRDRRTVTTHFGGDNESDYGYCLTLIGRINGVITSRAFKSIFESQETSVTERINQFLDSSPNKVLRLCLSGIDSEFSARELITNCIGRYFLDTARQGKFREKPIILFLDEAHSFIGKSVGTDDYRTRLDAFEIIAKEGRKYGLNICIATQRPRDVPEGVISQMGTLMVHRLINDKDRDMVERACGEIDRSASSFLPNLQPGELVLLGIDFPIPMTIQIGMPTTKPISEGAKYQEHWIRSTSQVSSEE
ncbi:ATP-binding protein [Pelagicoccus enzymogenes]|uniref:ATP-binding protein n=1 Tax=Pelagicoccus enzymogenes TaxID=2773457 RepID=UPI00281034A7|nr:ATP-binding protein [Pelagicoccus enzymogenes]MDQ8198189.1 ATP-binding protein [Pelagicoccus enzymogenes]